MNGITNVGQLLNDMEIERDDALARAEAAERERDFLAAEVAALRAQLAAGEWRREVSDAPLNTLVEIKAWGKRYDKRGKWKVYIGKFLVAEIYPGDCEWRPAPPCAAGKVNDGTDRSALRSG